MPTTEEQINQILAEIEILKKELEELKTRTIGDKLELEPMDTKVFNISAKKYKVRETDGITYSGITQVLTVRNSAGTGTCTITIKGGIIVASTC